MLTCLVLHRCFKLMVCCRSCKKDTSPVLRSRAVSPQRNAVRRSLSVSSSSSEEISVVSRPRPAIPTPKGPPPRRLPQIRRRGSDPGAWTERRGGGGGGGESSVRHDVETLPPGYQSPPQGFLSPRGGHVPALPILNHPHYHLHPYPENEIRGVAPPSYDEVLASEGYTLPPQVTQPGNR